MPMSPQPAGRPAVWRWSTIYPLAAAAGRLVPVGRGGERRAIALANPGIPGQPFATTTLWAARSHPVDELDYAPVVVRPEKIVCVGLN
jgi:gentisate 1,2-dioxygenase